MDEVSIDDLLKIPMRGCIPILVDGPAGASDVRRVPGGWIYREWTQRMHRRPDMSDWDEEWYVMHEAVRAAKAAMRNLWAARPTECTPLCRAIYDSVAALPDDLCEPRTATSEARERLRRSVEAWNKRRPTGDWKSHYEYVTGLGYAVALDAESVLAEIPPPRLTVGTWAWAVEQMRSGEKVRRRHWCGHPEYLCVVNGWIRYSDGDCWRGTMDMLDATDWELVPPPEPKHRPCECGGSVQWLVRWARLRVECDCGRAGPWKLTEAEAWAAWDKRTP